VKLAWKMQINCEILNKQEVFGKIIYF
jgi:hypothetical protein